MEDKDLEAFLKQDTGALYLPVRVENALHDIRESTQFLSDRGLSPIRTISDLLQWTERDLLLIKKMGRKGVKDIKDALAKHGLTLREDLAPQLPRKPISVNIIEPVSKIIHILQPFSPSVRVRIVRALRAIVGD